MFITQVIVGVSYRTEVQSTVRIEWNYTAELVPVGYIGRANCGGGACYWCWW